MPAHTTSPHITSAHLAAQPLARHRCPAARDAPPPLHTAAAAAAKWHGLWCLCHCFSCSLLCKGRNRCTRAVCQGRATADMRTAGRQQEGRVAQAGRVALAGRAAHPPARPPAHPPTHPPTHPAACVPGAPDSPAPRRAAGRMPVGQREGTQRRRSIEGAAGRGIELWRLLDARGMQAAWQLLCCMQAGIFLLSSWPTAPT